MTKIKTKQRPLQHVARVFVPKHLDTEELRRPVFNAVGGLTVAATGNGLWRAPDGTVYDEPVVVYEIITDNPTIDLLLEELADKLIAAGEQAVLIQLNDMGIMVERDDG